ncbi:MFS transporter [Amycolatopsis thermophila]|uniref:MFS family permease n=1 Tax=Amycolatopsis thermophila TaxID=206084 RepID=A0ABU0F5L5_9PSEU|nr:MFS transporter [Amycolatopsis thermophila]MDQ0382798.1 MFS family permease [Amycolatopsis thermophila]
MSGVRETQPSRRAVTPALLSLMLIILLYMSSFGMVLAILPVHVTRELGGGGVETGVVYGLFAVTALLTRPFVGWWADRSGARRVVVLGAAAAALATGVVPLGGGLVVLMALRLLYGFAHAAVYVPTMANVGAVAPPGRVGAAVSYFTLAHYTGLAVGPGIGSAVIGAAGTDVAWLCAAAVAGAGGLVALAVPQLRRPADRARPEPALAEVPDGLAPPRRRRPWHPAGLRPGVLMGLLLGGHTALAAFAAARAHEIGLADVTLPFAIYGVGSVVVRLVGARYVDRLGRARGPLLSGLLVLAAMVLIAVVPASWALNTGAGLLAAGMMLQGTTLTPLVFQRAPERERSAAVGTYSAFSDLSASLGGLLLGLAVGSYGSASGAFLASGAAAVVAIALVPWATGVPVRRVWSAAPVSSR